MAYIAPMRVDIGSIVRKKSVYVRGRANVPGGLVWVVVAMVGFDVCC